MIKFKFTIPLLLFLMLPISIKAMQGYDSYADIMVQVRNQAALESGNQLSTADLFQIVRRSIIWVSSDIKGREGIIHLTTTAEQPFYHISDTNFLSIRNVTYISEGHTKSIQAIPPQFVEQVFDLTALDYADMSIDNTPLAYDFFADSLQLVPIPLRENDTLLVKCWLAYEVQTENDKDSTKALPSGLKSTLLEPIIAFSCMLSSAKVQEYEKANYYGALYMGFKQSILQQQREPMDVPTSPQK